MFSSGSVQLLSRVQIFATPWTTACQDSLSITNSRSPPIPMSIELVMPSNHLILCHPLLLPYAIFPSIKVFSNESVSHIKWPKYWSFSFSIRPSKEYTGLISLRIDQLNLLAVQGTLKSLLQHHSSKALILQSTFTQLVSSVRGLSPFSKEFYILRKSHWLILKEFFCSWSLSSWCFTLLKESEVA